jgi:hypothetical protein
LTAGNSQSWPKFRLATTQTYLVSDAGAANSPCRYYRIVTPAQP